MTFLAGLLAATLAGYFINRARVRRRSASMQLRGDSAPREAAYRVPGSADQSRWRHGHLVVEAHGARWTSRSIGTGSSVGFDPLVVTGRRPLTTYERFWKLNPNLVVLHATASGTPIELAVWDDGRELLERRFGADHTA